MQPISNSSFLPGQQRAVLSFHHPNNKLFNENLTKAKPFSSPLHISQPPVYFSHLCLIFKSTLFSLKTSPCLFSSPVPSAFSSTSPHLAAGARLPPSDGRGPLFPLTSRRAPPPVPPASLRAAAGDLPRRSKQRRRQQHDTQASGRSRPPRRPAPARRGVVHPGRVQRAAGGAAVGALLRDVRQRRPDLLRHRGARQPQRRRTPRRGGPRAGGALRVAPRQGHRRGRPPARGHPVRHRVRAQEPLQVALRGSTGLQALGIRRHGRRRGRQVDDGRRLSRVGDQDERGRARRRQPAGPAVRSRESVRPRETRRKRQCRDSFPLL